MGTLKLTREEIFFGLFYKLGFGSKCVVFLSLVLTSFSRHFFQQFFFSYPYRRYHSSVDSFIHTIRLTKTRHVTSNQKCKLISVWKARRKNPSAVKQRVNIPLQSRRINRSVQAPKPNWACDGLSFLFLRDTCVATDKVMCGTETRPLKENSVKYSQQCGVTRGQCKQVEYELVKNIFCSFVTYVSFKNWEGLRKKGDYHFKNFPRKVNLKFIFLLKNIFLLFFEKKNVDGHPSSKILFQVFVSSIFRCKFFKMKNYQTKGMHDWSPCSIFKTTPTTIFYCWWLNLQNL